MPARYLPFHLLKDGRPIRFANWGGLGTGFIMQSEGRIIIKKKRVRLWGSRRESRRRPLVFIFI